MAQIFFHKEKKQFHLKNEEISYIFQVSPDGKLLHLYYGEAVPDGDYSYLIEMYHRPMSAFRQESDLLYSLEHLKQEFPEYGTTDFRHPAISMRQENGSRITDFVYYNYSIVNGKSPLRGLPATYVEDEKDAKTLIIRLEDRLTGVKVDLFYTIFRELPVITRHVEVNNKGRSPVYLESLMSLSLDLPDANYDWLQLSGAWGRERAVKKRSLQQGTQSIESTRGVSSHQHNPFIALMRPNADEDNGEVIATSLVYSGNFKIQAEVDTWNVTRCEVGINPFGFEWVLKSNEVFTSPEAILVYSKQGLNGMSHSFHDLFRRHLIRGFWRDSPRPIAINNWEATHFDFTEDNILSLAERAAEVGIELFVLDDGWFGRRNDDTSGLGDWFVNSERLPNGIASLSTKIKKLGLKFGLWFEPEMISKNSDLFNSHPGWHIHTPNRQEHHGRNQFVLNFACQEVVDFIFKQMSMTIDESQLDYIKWDMNRPLTDLYDITRPANQQGELFHRYVLGVYDLYSRLISAYPHILFESCSSGGGRFDPGMLYYAPQAWASDNSDAIDRLKIQYGSSLLYPLSSIGTHVSDVPNHQTNRKVPLQTRTHVALFGTFGYELDLNNLSPSELVDIKNHIIFFKKYRDLIHKGRFYRIKSAFDTNDRVAWLVVSEDQNVALLGEYKILTGVNLPFERTILQGLDPLKQYRVENKTLYGSALMRVGLTTSDASSGELDHLDPLRSSHDFESKITIIESC